MKRTLNLAVLLLTLGVAWACGAEKPAKSATFSSPNVVWAGIDYSQVKLIGAEDFHHPEAIFPAMLEAWNELFLHERLRQVENRTKKHVLVDINGITEKNKQATKSQIILNPTAEEALEKTHLPPEQIARLVKEYKLENKSGLGVVFIADRFIKHAKKGSGAVYVTAFDVETREVLFSERKTAGAGGFGFRNYWFHVIKEAEPALSRCR